MLHQRPVLRTFAQNTAFEQGWMTAPRDFAALRNLQANVCFSEACNYAGWGCVRAT